MGTIQTVSLLAVAVALFGHIAMLGASLYNARGTRAVAAADTAARRTEAILATIRWAVDAAGAATPKQTEAILAVLEPLGNDPALGEHDRAILVGVIHALNQPVTRIIAA